MAKISPTATLEAIEISALPDPFKVPQDKLVLPEYEKMSPIHADTVSDCVARILETFPDVEADHVTALVTDTIQIYHT